MIIDTNAYLGHYAFRRMIDADLGGSLRRMDRYGIERSIVSWLPSLFYRDVHSGNEELQALIRSHKERFAGVATINPKYVGWQRDLSEAIETWKMCGVSMAPSHHGYRLTDEPSLELLNRIETYGVPLVLSQRYEDRRQRHAWDLAEDLEIGTVLDVARRYPKLKIHFCNWIGLDGAKLVAAGLKDRCLIDFARLHVILNRDVPKLIEHLGIESIAFGSHAPFDYVGSSLVKLANLESLPADQFERICWQNASSFFRLD
jgi:predicted TIM-barrel fold metal-dependent hydrolase